MPASLSPLATATILVPVLLTSFGAAAPSAPMHSNPANSKPRAHGASTDSCWPVIEMKARRFAIDPATGAETQLTSPYRPGVLSPDGTALLSLGSIPGAHGFDLFVSDAVADGKGGITNSNTRRVTDIDGPVRGGHWMPDGRSVVFIHGDRDDAGLWMIDVSARDHIAVPRRLDAGDGAVHEFAVSSNGKIAYSVRRQRVGKVTHMDLFVSDGSAAEPILRDQFVTAMAWSPDGDRLAYGLINELRIRDTKTGAERVIRFADMNDQLVNTASDALAWSPDGSAILTAPRFVGGRMVGTVLFPDDKILIVPADDSGTPTLLKAREAVIGLSWIAANDVESHRATAAEAGVEARSPVVMPNHDQAR